MHDRERLDRVLRRLDEASRLLVRAAAEMQAKGIDTSLLVRPAVMIGEAIKEMTEMSSAQGDGKPSDATAGAATPMPIALTRSNTEGHTSVRTGHPK